MSPSTSRNWPRHDEGRDHAAARRDVTPALDPAAFAALLCDYCLRPEPDEQVVVRSTTLAAPLLLQLQRGLLEREAWPLLRLSLIHI